MTDLPARIEEAKINVMTLVAAEFDALIKGVTDEGKGGTATNDVYGLTIWTQGGVEVKVDDKAIDKMIKKHGNRMEWVLKRVRDLCDRTQFGEHRPTVNGRHAKINNWLKKAVEFDGGYGSSLADVGDEYERQHDGP